jgi:O-antigen/teichoic acid export membrane protein
MLLSIAGITRIYAANDYGIWILVLAFSGFFVPLTTMRYEIALVLSTGKPVMRRLFWVMLICSLVVMFFVAIAVALPSDQFLSRISGLPEHRAAWLLVTPVLLTAMGWQILVQALLTRQKQFLPINLALLTQSLVVAAVTILFGWLIAPRPAFAILGGLAGQAVNLLILCYVARKALAELLRSRPTLANLWRAMRFYRAYPLYALPYSISISFTERLMQVFLAALYSVTFLGAYYVARQIILAPAQIISASLRNVVLAYGARHQSIAETRPYVLRLFSGFCCVAAPALAGGIIWLSDLVNWALGTRWPQMGELAWWCMFPGVLLILTGSIDRLFDLAGRQRLSVILQVSSDIAALLTLFVVWKMRASGVEAVAALSVLQAVYNLIWLVVVLRITGIDWPSIIGRFLLFALLFAPALLLLAFVRSVFAHPFDLWLGLVLTCLLSGGAFALYVLWKPRWAIRNATA